MSTILDLAKFAAAAYGSTADIDTKKWKALDPMEANSVDFYAQAYQNIETGEIVITNRGTRPSSLKDILHDIQLTGNASHAGQDAAATYALKIATKYPGSPITLTGHSLGGNEAQAAAIALTKNQVPNITTVTFNAPGYGGYQVYGDPASYKAINIVAQGDAIHLAGFKHLGSQITIPAGPSPIYKPSLSWLALALGPVGAYGLGAKAAKDTLATAHSIDTIISYLKTQDTILASTIPFVGVEIPQSSLPPLMMPNISLTEDETILLQDGGSGKTEVSLSNDSEVKIVQTVGLNLQISNGTMQISNDGKGAHANKISTASGFAEESRLNDGSLQFNLHSYGADASATMTANGAFSGTASDPYGIASLNVAPDGSFSWKSTYDSNFDDSIIFGGVNSFPDHELLVHSNGTVNQDGTWQASYYFKNGQLAANIAVSQNGSAAEYYDDNGKIREKLTKTDGIISDVRYLYLTSGRLYEEDDLTHSDDYSTYYGSVKYYDEEGNISNGQVSPTDDDPWDRGSWMGAYRQLTANISTLKPGKTTYFTGAYVTRDSNGALTQAVAYTAAAGLVWNTDGDTGVDGDGNSAYYRRNADGSSTTSLRAITRADFTNWYSSDYSASSTTYNSDLTIGTSSFEEQVSGQVTKSNANFSNNGDLENIVYSNPNGTSDWYNDDDDGTIDWGEKDSNGVELSHYTSAYDGNSSHTLNPDGSSSYSETRADGWYAMQTTRKSGINSISFGGYATAEQLTGVRLGNDLVLSIPESKSKFTLANWYATANPVLDSIIFSDGITLTNTDLLKQFPVSGIIRGTESSDDLKGTDGNDVFDGGAGDDTIYMGGGSDVILFGKGDGNDAIYDADSETVLRLGTGIDPDTVEVSLDKDKLSFNIKESGDSLTFSNWSLNSQESFGHVEFADGTKWDSGKLLKLAMNSYFAKSAVVNVMAGSDYGSTIEGTVDSDGIFGTEGSDYIEAGDGNDIIFGGRGEGSDCIDGGNGNDIIFGGRGNDTLQGGEGDDTLSGGGGEDWLDGGVGHDLYVFASGDGEDYINYVRGDTSIDTIQFDSSVSSSDVHVRDDGSYDLTILYGTKDSVEIYNFFRNDGTYSIDGVQFADGTVWDDAKLIELSKEVPEIVGTDMSDQITGTDYSNVILAGSGDDIVTGGSISDLIYGENGNDSLSTHNRSWSSLLFGGEGNDILTPDDLDMVVGGKGNDDLHVGGYLNVVAFDKGDGVDSIFVDSRNAKFTVSLGGGISYDSLELSRDGNDLRLSSGDNEGLVFSEWYSSPENFDVTLQVIEGLEGANADLSDNAFDGRITDFNFEKLVGEFDAAQLNDQNLSQWHIAASLTGSMISSSNTTAIGGDLAYQYATTGNFDGISSANALDVLNSSDFGTAQVLRTRNAVANAAIRISQF